ncbi:ABC transporter permease [Fundidesulfovibrio terrae]|uniref:ABC transporter permease n=1 Tax=Fundidesulfovibrio terrae TaxID=2922866 RepID=UPI001FAFB1FB|nr:FtsX-like permease family protein [Fundidesulfovibrio terrae]
MKAPLALRLARRELRGGVRGLWTFLGCLALGVAAIATVGTLSEAFRASVAAEAASIMGGDLEVSLSSIPLKPAELQALTRLGRVSEVLEMRAMAENDAAPGAKRALVSLKAVDRAYPLLGAVTALPALEGAGSLADALAERGGVYGALVHPDLLARIQARVGDVIGVGDASFQIRGILTQEPDRAFRLLAFGPRLLVSLEGMESTGLARPGSMVRYEYRLALGAPAQTAEAARTLKQELDDPSIRVRTADEAAPTIRDGFTRLGGLMALVGLSALLLGGLGVSEAVSAYLESKTKTIATFKAVGAPGGLVFRVFFLQIMFLAACGIAVGLAVGAAVGYLGAPALAQVLPVAPKAGLYPKALALAGLFGALTAVAFALPPLSSRVHVSPLTLFRGYAAPERPRPGRAALAASALMGLALGWLVLESSPDARLGWGFIYSALGCTVAFWLAAKLLILVARALPRPRDPRLALAVTGLHRPGNPTGPVVACLGLGLTVLSAVALSDANFQHTMREELPAQAPSFFFLDVQPYQIDEFRQVLSSIEGVTRVEAAPSLRGRIVSVKGVPVENLQVPENVAWAVRGDRSLSTARGMSQGALITAGKWWPEDYSGPPLVSMDAEVAKGLGLRVGDRLSVSVLGREVELTVASLRRINWLSLSLNYAFILSPGVLDNDPMSYLATAYVDPSKPQAASEVYDRIGARFGNISIQRVDEALADVSNLAGQIAMAVRASAVVTLLAGLLVLAQSLRAAMARRQYETVIYKVCGATRRDIMTIMLCEHGMAGLAAGLAALMLGAGLSWFFVTRYMSVEWSFFAGPVLGVLGTAMALTLVMALSGMWRMLSGKAWPYLRNE